MQNTPEPSSAPDSTKRRVLIVAEHASARFGGEAILPLHYFRVLRKRNIEAWLIVHERTRHELTALLPNDVERIRFIPDTRFQIWLFRVGKILPGQIRHFTIGFLSRLSSQRRARRMARELVAEQRIDVVHQPIPVSPKESSLLYDLGAPLIIGPMNGGMSYPPGFGTMQGGFSRGFMRIGRAISGLLNRLMPGKLRADVLLVANERTRAALPAGIRGKVIELPENGVDLSLWTTKTQEAQASTQTRLVFSGRLVDWKAVDVLLEAFATVAKSCDATLDILGDGAMRPALQAQCKSLQLTDRVKFHGWVPQTQLAARLRDADILVLPSLYECGGAVVLEAMAAGIPVIASDWGGPTDYLDESCGILVPPKSRQQFVEDLAAAMTKLCTDPDLRLAMGISGRKKVQEQFDWERKVDRMMEIYRLTLPTNQRGNGTFPR
ncbi:MAG TPA: glycosyltransferase family 4 protein [Humisphaera sp.]|jgi:glycosyltransferase involved in cell wall biosynthesis|nr:glycosyltransferase family 4 protein [Humisphaera sp.]